MGIIQVLNVLPTHHKNSSEKRFSNGKKSFFLFFRYLGKGRETSAFTHGTLRQTVHIPPVSCSWRLGDNDWKTRIAYCLSDPVVKASAFEAVSRQLVQEDFPYAHLPNVLGLMDMIQEVRVQLKKMSYK